MQIHDAITAWTQDRTKRQNYDPYNTAKLRRILNRMAEACGWQTVQDVTPVSVAGYSHKLADLGLAKSTISNHLSAVRAFGAYLTELGVWKSNAIREVRSPRIRACDRGLGARAFSEDEAARLIDVARDKEATDARASKYGPNRSTLYALLWETGLRYSEATRLVHADVNHKTLVLTVREDKAARGDRLPISGELAGLVNDLRVFNQAKPHARVFRMVSHNTLARDMKRAGVPRRVDGQGGLWHCFRKGMATELLRSGVPLEMAAKFTRHRDVKVLARHYFDPGMADMRRVMESRNLKLSACPVGDETIRSIRQRLPTNQSSPA